MRPRLRNTVLAALLALVPLLSPGPATAAPRDEAERLIEQGNALRKAGDDEGALPVLQKAYQVSPGPRTAAQLGMVEWALLRWVEADDHLTEALKGSDNDPWLRKHRSDLELSLAKVKKQVSRIEITGEPEGAEALVNGRSVGRVPLTSAVRVPAGSVDVELRAPGYKPLLRTLVVTGGQYQPVVLRLEREVGGPTASGGTAGQVEAERDEDAAPDRPGSWRKWTVATAVAGAAIGVGVGAYGALRHDSKVDSFSAAKCATSGGKGVYNGGGPDNGKSTPDCQSKYNDFTSARKLAIIGFSAAGAFAVTALIIQLTAPDARDSREYAARASAPICTPDLVGRGITCGLRF